MTGQRSVEVPLFSKAPFANYDIIVYFGGGLLFILMIYRYIAAPFYIFYIGGLKPFPVGSFIYQVIFAVILLAVIYVAGHLLAYAAAHFIERFVNKTCGSFSNIVVLSANNSETFNEDFYSEVDSNLKQEFTLKKNPLLIIAHFPFLIWYLIVKRFKLFSSLDTRVPRKMIDLLSTKVEKFFPEVSINKKHKWFRWVEYYTYYHAPISASSMYNYLAISGFMRSISLLTLLGFWLELFHFLYYLLYHHWLIHVAKGFLGLILYLLAYFVGYVCSLTAYVKFYRRYVEEAIMGFILEVPSSDPNINAITAK